MNRRDIFKYVAAVPVAGFATVVADKATDKTPQKTYREVYDRIKSEVDHNKDDMHL